MLTSCTFLNDQNPLPPPETLNELVVAVLEAPGFFEKEGQTLSGFEHDLINQFSSSLGVKARFISAKDFNQLGNLLATHQVHMAASLPPNRADFLFSHPLRSISHWIVGRDDSLGPDDLASLSGHTVAIIAGSPLAQELRALDEQSRPTVVEITNMDELTLLSQVAAQKISLAAVSDINLDLASNFYPELAPRVHLPGKTELSWAFPSQEKPATRSIIKPITQPFPAPNLKPLRLRADAFIEQAHQDGTIARLNDRYFGNVKRINAMGIAQFIKDSQLLLPKLRRHFFAAQNLTGIDWRLLAALAYQESHWDPLATSPTNVRGIMMLTEETADHLGVDNRLDAASSIRGGARYLEELINQLPNNIQPPDRLWLALAGYNLGMGHLRGALAIAQDMHRDPTSWYEMKKVLPLLSRPEVYDRLKSGPARGGEAVILVENIRTYYSILQRLTPAKNTTSFGVFETVKPAAKTAPLQSAGQARLNLFAPARPSTALTPWAR